MNEFLQAILADPESDGPRLVLADHLMERGDPRGELISLQIAIARGGGTPEAEARVAGLIDRCWEDLAGHVRAAGVQHFCVRRGFVEAITMNDKRLAQLPELMAQAPILQLKLTGARDGAERLSKMRELMRLRVLDLHGLAIGNRRCVKLLRSGLLSNINRLVLTANSLGPPVARELTRIGSQLAALEHLHLDVNQLGEAGVTLVVRSHLLGQLSTLIVDDHNLSEGALLRLNRAGVARHASDASDGVWFPRS